MRPNDVLEHVRGMNLNETLKESLQKTLTILSEEKKGKSIQERMSAVLLSLSDALKDANEKKILQVHSRIRSEMRSLLSEKTFLDNLGYGQQIALCQDPDDFRKLFTYLQLTDAQWQSANFLQKNGWNGLYAAIARVGRFKEGGWTDFLKFMGISVEPTWTEKIRACTTPEDFKKLFEGQGIADPDWQNAGFLQSNGHSALYQAISKRDARFKEGGWKSFLKFMNIVVEISARDKVRACSKPKHFLKLFADLGLTGDAWKTPTSLFQSGHGAVYNAIADDPRFNEGKWPVFLQFMGEQIIESWPKRVKNCTNPADFFALFSMEKISEEGKWDNAGWLQKNGFSPLYSSIVSDTRFGSWPVFLKFMGYEKEVSWSDHVDACKKPEDFLELFVRIGIEDDNWQTGNFLITNGHGAVYRAIVNVKKFKTWGDFLIFMGVENEESWPAKVRSCTTQNDFLLLFRSIGISNEEWHRSTYFINNGLKSLYSAIIGNSRFKDGGWDAFLVFMGVVVEGSWIQRVKECHSRKDFLALFKANGIENDEWQKYQYFRENKLSGLIAALTKDPRFKDGGWNAFLEYMNVAVRISWAQRVRNCQTSSDFLQLFSELELVENEWQSSTQLVKAGFTGLLAAINIDERFAGKGWGAFLQFMGITKEIPWTHRVRLCLVPEDFLAIFKEIGLEHDWKTGFNLSKSGFNALYQAITVYDARFNDGGWASFIRFMEKNEDIREFEKLGNLNLHEAISLLGSDPSKLALYLQFAHPELTQEEIDQLVRRSFKGLVSISNQKKEDEYLGWLTELPRVNLDAEISPQTEENTVVISGTARDAECIYISGNWNRRVQVQAEGKFSVAIPLQTGGQNPIRIVALDREKKIRSEQLVFTVEQQGEADDVSALFELLGQLRTDLLAEIQKDPGRMEFFVACAEKVLIKRFSRSFPEGETYVQNLLAQNKSKAIQTVLNRVLKNFRAIEKIRLPNVKAGSLMFFQKFCVWEMQKRMNAGEPGVNLSNDPGLGKTRTILAALAQEEAAIFTPNAVVSAWEEEADAILLQPDLLVMRDLPHAKRKDLLRNAKHPRLVTNIDFLQNPEDAERFELLSGDNTVVVHDEAHSRANEESLQSRGAKQLRHKFQINVTATLAKNPKKLRRMLHTLEPENPHFRDDKAFQKAFPANDAQALKTLKLLVDKYTIRFRKEDVMEEVDPELLLSQQLHRLPRKNVIPPEQMGAFEMSEDQAHAIYRMFLNWAEWSRTYGHYIPDDDISEEDHLRSGGNLVKRHALRQTVNNPSYIGSKATDAKAREAQRVVEKCMKEGRKVVIFCKYTAQALKYAELFEKYNPALYTGLTGKEGEKKNAENVPVKYKRQPGVHGFKGAWVFDKNGYPVEDASGDPMPALDYERLTFQNAADRKIIICTEKAGAVGTTFTAGKALIDDDLSDDVIMDIQKKDRIHRIDPQRLTHPTADYYTLSSRYPKNFLEDMKKRWVVKQGDGTYREYSSQSAARRDPHLQKEKSPQTAYDTFFAQGTYDEVQGYNLEVQRQTFRLINDGIADESALQEDQMPFIGLQNGNGAAK